MPEEKSGQSSAPAQSGFKWELEQDFVCRVDARIRLRVGYFPTDRHRWSVDDIKVAANLAEGICVSVPDAMRAAELACTAILNRRSLKLVWLASLSWSAFTGRRSARIEARDHHYEFRVYERTPPVYLHLSKGEARSLDEAMVCCEELLRVSGEVAHVEELLRVSSEVAHVG